MPQLYKKFHITSESIASHLDIPLIAESAAAEQSDISFEIFSLFTHRLLDEARQNGYEEGQKDYQAQIAIKEQTLNTLLQSIPEAIEQNRMHLKKDLADIILTIIQQLFLQQPPDTQVLEKQMNAILAELNQQHTVKIYLHPTDISHVQQGEIQLHTHALQNVEIVAQPALLQGGCLIHSEHGIFDISLENRFQRFLHILQAIQQEHMHASLA